MNNISRKQYQYNGLIFLSYYWIFFILLYGCNSSFQKYDEDIKINLSRVEISNFLGEGHKLASQALSRGEINTETYQKINNNWLEHYSELLININLNDFSVFVWSQNNSKDSNLRLLKKEYYADLQKEILIALNNSILHMALGKVGDDIGLMLTIIPKENNDVFKRIFIKNLYHPDAYKVFENR